MTLFNKEIARAYIIDFFPDPTITNPLTVFLQQDTITNVLIPQTREEVLGFLTDIEHEVGEEGCLIHLVGHGDDVRLGFGRQGLSFRYEEMIGPFSRINASCGDSLVVNASLMCLSDPFQTVFGNHPEVFHACIYSTEIRSSQSLKQLVNIYQKCKIGVDTETAIDQENDAIEDSQDIRPFGYSH